MRIKDCALSAFPDFGLDIGDNPYKLTVIENKNSRRTPQLLCSAHDRGVT